ncbi:hypothetical protein C6P40_002970 [Pichia californica]|uniref:Actin n=1 Tax=Pichia californica TaxID=460514 RepID=A0A9P6WH52_9ASCO|nr:hypothetical protein C6P42_005397 [[Candida] californica]KAG0687040.1 hypothetical protein C6P40_002970 [[Candida] californica]
MEELYNQPIVLDNGSGTIRCGFSTDEAPRVNYSNILGRPKYYKIDYLPSDINIDDTFVGNHAQLNRGLLKLTYPIEHGTIKDWNSLELIWQQVLLHDLIDNNTNNEISLKEHTMLITEHPFSERRQREKIGELLFETFGLGAINIAIPSVLSLYSTGRTTGVSIDIGDGVCCVAPIFEGFTLPGSIKRINIGGRDITKQLQIELMKDGYSFNSSSEFEIVRNMKERLGFIKQKNDLNEYNKDNDFEKFQLPDGKSLKVRKQSLNKSCEILFKPEIYGFEYDKFPNIISDSINSTDMELRGKFFENIILSGGCTMIKNFGSRILNDLRNIDQEIKLKIYSSPERKNNTFMGGSILSSLSTFNNIVISKKQFMENPECIHDTYF